MRLPQIPQERKWGRCWMQKHTVHPSLPVKCGENSHNRTLNIQVEPQNKRTPAPTRLYLDSICLYQTISHTHHHTHKTHKPPDTLTGQHATPPSHPLLTGLCQTPWSPVGSVSLRTLDSDAPTRLRTTHNLGDL